MITLPLKKCGIETFGKTAPANESDEVWEAVLNSANITELTKVKDTACRCTGTHHQ